MDRQMQLALQIRAIVDGLKNVEALSKEIGSVGTASGQASKAAGQMGDSLGAVTQGSDQAGRSLGTLSALAKGMAAIFAANELRQFAAELVDVSAQYGKLRASLNTVTNSTLEAAAAWDLIQQFQADAPIYTVEQVTEAFIKLKALGLDPSEQALRSYGNTSAAMGKDIMQFVEAVADAVTGEFERLKEFGIKSSAQGDQVAFTFQGMTTRVGNNAKEIEGYLRSIGEVQFANGIKNQSEEAAGSLGKLATAAEKTKLSIAETSDVKGILGQLVEWLNQSEDTFRALDDTSGKTTDQLMEMHDAIVRMINLRSEGTDLFDVAMVERYRAKLREVDALMEILAKHEGPKQAAQAVDEAAQAVDEFADKLGKSLANADKFKAGIDALAASTQTLQAQYDGLIAVAEAERKAAEASGNTATALAKAGEVRQLQVEKAQSHADSLRAEAAALEEYAAKVKTAVDADGQRSAAEQAAVAEAEQAAAARHAAAAAAEAEAQALAQLPDSLSQVNQEQALGVDQLEKYRAAAQAAIGDVQSLAAAVADGRGSEAELAEARATAAGSLETYRQALATYTQQQQAASEAASREAALLGQGYDTRIAQVQALQAAAKARGDEAAAAQAGIQILQLEAAKSAALAEAKQKEYEALLSVIDAKLKEAEADGTLTQEEQKALKAAQDAATAKRLEAEQSKAAAAQKSAEADGARKAAEAAKKQAGANKERADAQAGANKKTEDSISLGITGQKVLEAYNAIILAGSDAWSQYRASVKLAQDAQEQLNRANTMAQQFQQAASSGRNLESLLSRLGVRSQDLGEITQSTARQFSLLDQQQLSGLNGAIQSAAQKLQAMRDSAQSLLSSLNSAALSQAASTAGTGDTTAENIAERTQIAARQAAEEFRARMAAINEQLAAARAAGDAATIASLTKAAELARQLYEQNLANLSEAAKKAAEDYQDSIEAVNRTGKSYADDIADSIREINREGMSAAEVQADMQAQLAEKIRKAQDAIRQGDMDYAKELQASIVQISKALGSSSSKNKDAAIKGLQAAKSLNDQIVKAQIGEIAKLKNAQLAAAKEVHDATMRYIQQEGEARANVLRSSTRRVTTTITAATGGLIAGEGQLVTTPTVPDGTSKSDLSPRNTTTKHFSAGGTVSGSGSGDTVPAMLTPGEVVLRKAAVQDLGVNLALDLNARGRTALRSAHVQVPTLPRQFLSAGGLVGQPAGPAAPEVTVRLVTDRGVTTARLPRDAATAAVLRDLKSAAAVRVGR